MAVDAIQPTTTNLKDISVTNQGQQTQKAETSQQDLFLKMLMTSVKNQDPTKPMDVTDQIAQLATFTQVEQLEKANVNLTNLANLSSSIMSRSDIAYIGKSVEAKTDIFKYDGKDVDFTYVTSGADKIELQIINEDGEVVRTVEGNTDKGEHSFVWDGKNNEGVVLGNANYKIKIQAVDSNGVEVPAVASIRGIVKQVITEGGVSILVLENGTMLNSDMIVSIEDNKEQILNPNGNT